MVSVPAGRVDVARTATPAALKGTVPSDAPLLKNSTVPVGVPVDGGAAVAVTVRVTVVPNAAVLGFAVRVRIAGAMPMPFSGTTCVEPGMERSLSVVMSLPLSGPPVMGVKLTTSVQDFPAASVAVAELALSCGQVEPLPMVKPGVMLGLAPAAGVA